MAFRMILATTSRRPTRMVRTLCRDLAYVIPSLKRVNRGKMSLHDVGEKAVDVGADKVLIIDRWKGGPGRMRFFEVKEGLSQVPPQLYIRGVKLRRDFKIRKPSSHRLFIGDLEKALEVRRLGEMFSRFFELPIIELNEMDSHDNFMIMRLSPDLNHTIRVSFYLMPKNLEVGPRIRISHAVWEI